MPSSAQWIRVGFALSVGTTAVVLFHWYGLGGCNLARKSRYDDDEDPSDPIMQLSNMLCCPVAYVLGACGYCGAAAAGLWGLVVARERGFTAAAAASAALGRTCCCGRCDGCAAGPVAVAFACVMLVALGVLSVFKVGPCVAQWYVHSAATFLFFLFGNGLLCVQIFARRGTGYYSNLALFRGRTRLKAAAAVCGAASLGAWRLDPLAGEYMSIGGILAAVLAFERDVALGAAILAGDRTVAPRAAPSKIGPPATLLDPAKAALRRELQRRRSQDDGTWDQVLVFGDDDDDEAREPEADVDVGEDPPLEVTWLPASARAPRDDDDASDAGGCACLGFPDFDGCGGGAV